MWFAKAAVCDPCVASRWRLERGRRGWVWVWGSPHRSAVIRRGCVVTETVICVGGCGRVACSVLEGNSDRTRPRPPTPFACFK